MDFGFKAFFGGLLVALGLWILNFVRGLKKQDYDLSKRERDFDIKEMDNKVDTIDTAELLRRARKRTEDRRSGDKP